MPHTIIDNILKEDGGNLLLEDGTSFYVIEGAVGVAGVHASGGRSKKPKRYVVEVDGELFQVSNIAEAESVLMQVRQLAQEAAAQITTEVVTKPPRVTVKTSLGKATTSKVLQREISRTQKAITQAYITRSKQIQKQREDEQAFSLQIQKRLKDEEDVVITLLM